MLNISGKTKLTLDQVKQKTKDFFGSKGLNLEVTEDANDHMIFEGGGGYVDVSFCEEEKKNRVEIVTQEWEYQVKQFLSEL